MDADATTVPVSSVERTDRSFIVTAGRSSAALKDSIQAIGLLNPPCLAYARQQGRYRIVCGSRRIEAVSTLGWPKVPARVFHPGADEKELLRYALLDNLAHRDFNPVEKANSIERLLKFFPEREVVATYLPLLGMPASVRVLEDARALARLEDGVQDAVARGVIPDRIAVRLAALPADDRRSLCRLFSAVNLSSSKQAEIIENCRDISRRDGVSIRELLEDACLNEALAGERLNRSQQGELIRQRLKKRRFPRLSRREQQFEALTNKMRLPANITLSPPPFFEGDTFTVRVSIKSAADMNAAGEQLKSLSAHPLLRELLEA